MQAIGKEELLQCSRGKSRHGRALTRGPMSADETGAGADRFSSAW